MGRKLYMAVDLGTSFIKVGIYDKEGKLVVGNQESVSEERPEPGVFIQRGDMLFDTMCMCIRKASDSLGREASEICALSFTGQMAGAMAVDENWNDITTWTCTLDSRYIPFADKQRKKYKKMFYEMSGTNAPVMCAKYEWFKETFPEEHEKIKKYVMLNGYMIGRLSGISVSDAKIDYSLIAWTGMADIAKRSWSEDICGKIGINMSHLPAIVDSTCIGGYLNEDNAKKLNLTSGIPLVLGAGDKVSGCVGAAISEEGETIFEAASYGAISSKVKDVRLDKKEGYYDVIASQDDLGFYVHKYMQGSGISIDWFIETFVKEDGSNKGFAFVEDLADKVPEGSRKMLAIGALSGSAMPFDGNLRGMFIGHSWSHRKEHFYRALLEGLSYDLALTIERIKDQYNLKRDTVIRLIGGGAKSKIWPQMLADVTGYDFAILDREDVAMWGAALLAAKAVGDIECIEETAKEHVTIQKTYTTNPNAYKTYQPYVQLYKELLRDSALIYSRLNQIDG